MMQMYEVFVNEHRIILTNKISKEEGFKLFLLETVDIDDVITQLNKGKIKCAHIYYKDKSTLFKKFCKKVPLVVAAGGMVVNKNQDTLFIYRNDKWDLPKGKVDKGEAIEDRSEEHTSELQSRENLVCRLLLEKKNKKT